MTRESFVSCPYMRIKKYSPAQYGQIEDIRWVSLGGCGLMDKDKRKPVLEVMYLYQDSRLRGRCLCFI